MKFILNVNQLIPKVTEFINKNIFLSSLVGVLYWLSIHLIINYTKENLYYVSIPYLLYEFPFIHLLFQGHDGIFAIMSYYFLVFNLVYLILVILRELSKWATFLFIVGYFLLSIPFIDMRTIFI